MKILLLATSLLIATTGAQAGALFIHEGFDDLAASGWIVVNASSPPGSSGWFQGNAAVFPAAQGAPDSYAAADANSRGTAGGTISTWLISPEIDFHLDELSFLARAASAGAGDALNVMISDQGSSLDLGAFGLLLAVNPGNVPGGMPTDWTSFFASVPFGSGSGRIAFQYTAGPDDVASYVGVDSVFVAPRLCLVPNAVCPEPASLPLAATALVIGVSLSRRGRRPRRGARA